MARDMAILLASGTSKFGKTARNVRNVQASVPATARL